MSKFSRLFLALILLTSITACNKKTNSDDPKLDEKIKNYILNHPEVLIQAVQNYQDKSEADQDKKAESNLGAKHTELFDNPHSPVYGNLNGKTQIVEFFDYNCGYCKHMLPDLIKIVDGNKDAKLIFKELPILSPTSETTALAALIVYDLQPDKYFAFHRALMEHNGEKTDAAIAGILKEQGLDADKIMGYMKDKKYQDILADNIALAKDLSVTGTPTFVLSNGKIVRGAVGYKALMAIIGGKDVNQAVRDNPPE